MSSQDPFTRGSAVTILPGVPLEGVPAPRSEEDALAGPAAAPAAPAPSFAPPLAPPPPAPPPPAPAPMAPPAAPVGQFGTPAFTSPPPPVAQQPVSYPSAHVFSSDIPAAPQAFAADIPTAPSAFTSGPIGAPPAPVAAPPSGALSPGQQLPFGQAATVPSQPLPGLAPGAFQPLPSQTGLEAPAQDVAVEDDKPAKAGKRRRETSGGSNARLLVAGALVLGAAAGWFGQGYLGNSSTTTPTSISSTVTPAVSHRVVPLGAVASLGTLQLLPKPWVTTAQQALLASSVVSRSTPAYFGAGGSHGTYAEIGVSVGTISATAANVGTVFPAGPGGGTVRCSVSRTGLQNTSWCTWKDSKTSGMVTSFATPTQAQAYTWTQLVRGTLEH